MSDRDARAVALVTVIAQVAGREGREVAKRAAGDPIAFADASKRVVAALATEARTKIDSARDGFQLLSANGLEELCSEAAINIILLREIVAALSPSEMKLAEAALGKIESEIVDLCDRILEKQRSMN